MICQQAVLHDGLCMVICLAGNVLVVHLVKFKILAKDTIIKAQVESLVGLDPCIKPEEDLRLIDLKQGIRGQVET